MKSIAIIICLGLTSCSALLSGGIGTSGSLLSQVDNLVPELVLQKYQALHNLKVGMEAIDAAPGTVTMVTPGPQVVPQ